MCATCWKEPEVGPEIMDLSILPPLNAFFLLEDFGFSVPTFVVVTFL